MSQTTLKYKGLELLCKVNTIEKFRQGKLGKDNVVITDEIFKSIQKGERANNADLENIFKTTDMSKCIDIMLENGTYPLSADERKEIVERKRHEIITYIQNHYVDPKTSLPIPITRIEVALTSMKAKVDYQTPVDKLLKPILKKLPETIPVKKQEGMSGILEIEHQYLGQAYGIISSYCKIQSEDYDATGCKFMVSIIPSDYEQLLEKLIKVTDGNYEFTMN
jgi:ribosome maturation protein SDO1